MRVRIRREKTPEPPPEPPSEEDHLRASRIIWTYANMGTGGRREEYAVNEILDWIEEERDA